MTLDLSEVKKIAVQNGMNQPYVGVTWMCLESELLSFAQACYAMGAAEQRERDAKICMDEKHWHWHPRKFAEAIRSQE